MKLNAKVWLLLLAVVVVIVAAFAVMLMSSGKALAANETSVQVGEGTVIQCGSVNNGGSDRVNYYVTPPQFDGGWAWHNLQDRNGGTYYQGSKVWGFWVKADAGPSAWEWKAGQTRRYPHPNDGGPPDRKVNGKQFGKAVQVGKYQQVHVCILQKTKDYGSWTIVSPGDSRR